jgi:hypothetical protein
MLLQPKEFNVTEKNHYLVNVSSTNEPNVYAKISPCDAEQVLLYKWSLKFGGDGKQYVRAVDRSAKPYKQIMLHRLVMAPPSDADIDHINGDPLDNRRENLRIATTQQNLRNMRPHRDGSSVYKGVSWHKASKKWRAVLTVDGKQQCIGYFRDPAVAAAAYDERAKVAFGEFAYLNLTKVQSA